MNPQKEFQIEKLHVRVYDNQDEIGKAAADLVAKEINRLLKNQPEIRIVFAASKSQDQFLEYFRKIEYINWQKITAFHMDEYLSLFAGHPQTFGNYLRKHLFDAVNVKQVHFINPEPDDVALECKRYTSLLQEKPIDIVCMGIGENGHIAFNDPHVADFNDPELVKVVTMDDKCRWQQVHDGCFASFDEVPKQAITLTIPALMSADYISVVVPGPTKSQAVYDTINGSIDTSCPASIIRKHNNTNLFLDLDSAVLLKNA